MQNKPSKRHREAAELVLQWVAQRLRRGGSLAVAKAPRRHVERHAEVTRPVDAAHERWESP